MVTVCKVLIVALQLHSLLLVEACHNAQHAAEAEAAGMDASGRRRRDVSVRNQTFGKDADPDLSNFFTECMTKKTGAFFMSWRSVIDFILRDTFWFQATDVEYCGGRRDTVKCWQRRLPFLLRTDSALLTPGQDCIKEYDGNVKEERGVKYEQFYQRHYESFDYEISDGEFQRWKGVANGDAIEDSIADEIGDAIGDTIGGAIGDAIGDTVGNAIGDVFNSATDILNNLDVKFTSPRTSFLEITKPTQSSVLSILSFKSWESQCPAFSILEYGHCVAEAVAALIRNETIFGMFPSLQFWNEASIRKFVQFHHSSCRITTQMKSGLVSYIENCYTSDSPPSSQSPDPHILSLSPCFILELPEIVKPTSPVYTPVSNCTDILLNDTEANLKRPARKGRIGKCKKGDHWTRWFNAGPPDLDGDMETLDDLRVKFRGRICENPLAVDARTVVGHKFHSKTGQTIYLSQNDGLRCFNSEQTDGTCLDYKLRFCCKIEEEKCEGGHQWTAWYNVDKPSQGGDDESLLKHVAKNGVCERPLAIKARLRRNKKHYWKGYNIVDISPEIGFVCTSSEQKNKRCRDYAVSFCCPAANKEIYLL